MNRQQHIALWLRMLAKNEIRLARKQYQVLSWQSKVISSAYENEGQAAAEFSLLDSQTKTYESLVTGYTATTKELISYTFEQLGNEGKSTFQEIVQSFIATEALTKSKLITGTTIAILRNVILHGQKEGLGNTQIAANIRRAVSSIAPARARTIARTETHNAATFGMQVAAEETEVKLVREWVSVADDRTRDEHDEADGQQRGMDEPFDVGGELIDRPGEGSAENSINCRCTIIYTPIGF